MTFFECWNTFFTKLSVLSIFPRRNAYSSMIFSTSDAIFLTFFSHDLRTWSFSLYGST
uniref:Uncharacterized protein n=1 Tax=Arundo donax TaxID=35708 RepID=A0A0A8ZMJ3_ARUDO